MTTGTPPQRPRTRRRSKPSLARRIRRFWVLGLLVALPIVGGGYAVASLPAFRLHELSVTGNARVSRAEIIARAAIDPDRNVWLLDRGAVEARIEAIPYVATARVHRRPPGNVWIDIAERRPAACIRDADGHEMLVDDALRVLDDVCTAEAHVTLDVRSAVDVAPGAFVRDPEALELQADAEALAADERYTTFAHDAYGDLEATMPSGIEVRFGDEDDLEHKQRLVAPILAEVGPRLANVRTVDLRAPSTPVVEYRR